MRSQFTIGQIAKQAGVGIETIRFYEGKGLLPRPVRNRAGYRQYTEDTIARLRFIGRAKDLGFSLTEIKELLVLRVRGAGSCVRIKARTEAKLAAVTAKIHDLQRINRVLRTLIRNCDAKASTEECPILAALGAPHTEEI